jgi:hypothetical protein
MSSAYLFNNKMEQVPQCEHQPKISFSNNKINRQEALVR